MKLDGKSIKIQAMLYMYIPVMIFLVGYTKWYFALPTGFVLILCLILFIRDDDLYKPEGNWGLYDPDAYMEPGDERGEDVSVHPAIFLIAVIAIVAVCLFSGIGGVFPQAGDWEKHNAVLRDLMQRSWPVYYDKYDPSMLTYYLGQYLVPAIVGKITGSFDAANAVMAAYCIYGLLLVYLLLIRLTKADNAKKQLLAVAVMLFFCGALCLVQMLLKLIYTDRMYSLGSYHWVLVDGIMIQFRSNLVMIRWVLPQIIVPWMAVMIYMEKIKRAEYYVLILLPSLLFGSFSFAALAAMAILTTIIMLLNRKLTIRRVLSPLNILPALSLGSILFFYFLGNLQVDKPVSSGFRFEIYDLKHIAVYLIFCFLMFGVYTICVYDKNKYDPLFYVNTLIMLVLPWFRMGLCNDVVMSGSISSLFVLMIMVLELLFDEGNSTKLGICKGIVIVMLMLGMTYPICELRDNIRYNSEGMNTASAYASMEDFTRRGDSEISEDLMYNYYTYDMDGKIFCEYIARVAP